VVHTTNGELAGYVHTQEEGKHSFLDLTLVEGEGGREGGREEKW